MYIPDDTIVYAVGDVHGCSRLLATVMDWIDEHAAGHSFAQKKIVFLGDVIDRGPDSRGVIDRLLPESPNGLEMICLRGNHEDMMLRVLNTGAGLATWLKNGGIPTLQCYGIDNIDTLARSSPAFIRQTLIAAVPRAHQAFLSNTVLSYQSGGYLFVHAGLRPGIAIDRQDPLDMMWIRREFTQSTADFGVVVVHGHTVSHEPSERTNALGLDTGAVATGRLSCAALWQDQRLYFTTPSVQS